MSTLTERSDHSDQNDCSHEGQTHGGRVVGNRGGEASPAVWYIPATLITVAVMLMITTATRGSIVNLTGLAEAWASITVAIVLQALPFLVLGVIVSGVIAAFIPETFLRRVVPSSPFLAVPTAAGASFFLPGCECASVPVAQSLMRRSIPPAAALTFLVASPAINPVVLVSTAVAFRGQPMMVFARFAAAIIAAILIGWVWGTFGKKVPMDDRGLHTHAGASRLDIFRASALHDLMNAGGFLAMGAMVAAVIKVAVPKAWFDTVNQYPIIACLVMAALAVLLSLCSEADAFIAASFTQVSPTAQLVFMTVGPMVDLKLMAMQYGAWGRRFVLLFVPLALVLSTTMAIIVGRLLFGQL